MCDDVFNGIGRALGAVATGGLSELFPKSIAGDIGRVTGDVLTLGLAKSSSGAIPAAPAAPTPGVLKAPSTDTPAVQQAVADAAQRRAQKFGWASTILSSIGSSQGGMGPSRTTIGS